MAHNFSQIIDLSLGIIVGNSTGHSDGMLLSQVVLLLSGNAHSL
jgi:hypothetical protein